MSDEPNFGTENEQAAPTGYISREELNSILAERDRQHAGEIAAMRAKMPVAIVAQHGGGPGNDHHQPSWSLAEQEAAQRGEILDHWIVRE